MIINGKTVGYAMITPAQIGEAVNAYIAENPDVIGGAAVEESVKAYLKENPITAGDVFYVTASTDSTEDAAETSCTADKTIAEIEEAAYADFLPVYLLFPYLHANGNTLYCRIPLTKAHGGSCEFAGVLQTDDGAEIITAYMEGDDYFSVFRRPVPTAEAVEENKSRIDTLSDDVQQHGDQIRRLEEDVAGGVSPVASVTQTDSGAVISITDKNGTTTATIANGKDGAAGATGAAGKDGTSVTVASVSESTADGGSNVVAFSDGKAVTIKNGSKGSKGEAGKTPVKGTDYFTAADKAEMVEEVQVAMDGIPSYWQEHLDEKVAAIREAMLTAGANKSAFFFYSDAHWSNATTYTAKKAPTLLKYLCKNTPINKTNFGGDIVSAEAADAETMAYLWEWRNLLHGLPNHHSVVGNHDDGNATNNLFSENYVYGYLLAPEESCDIVRGDGAMYYYIDNPAEKTRYLYLDTAYKGVTTEEQEFVKSALLSTPENWHIVAIAHLWYHNDYTTYPPVLTGFDTNAKKLLDMFDNFNARSGEYAECTAWVEFCIGGHYHLDHVEHTNGGIPVIIVEADTLHDRSGTMPKAGTTDESAISAVIADYNTKTVKIIRVGRGTDYETEIEVKTVSYTNVILLSIDSTGAIFNGGKGWADNSRIGSGKLESYIGTSTFYITGHIEIDPTIDNTIRMRNITFNSTATDSKLGIAFYDESFARIAPRTSSSNNWLQPSAIADSTNGYDAVLNGTNIEQFIFEAGNHITNTAVKYIAICAEYIGDDSIITINETID